MRKKVVMVNGAPGVGKTWLAQQLRKLYQITPVGLNEALIDTMCVITGLDLYCPEIYAAFKEGTFENGKTGRAWMITVSEESKMFYQTVWVERFVDKLLLRSGTTYVCDSFGFPIEFAALIGNDLVDMLTVYIGAEQTIEGDYRQFEGDSRFDLSRHCSIRAVNSDEALEKVKVSLRNRNWI